MDPVTPQHARCQDDNTAICPGPHGEPLPPTLTLVGPKDRRRGEVEAFVAQTFAERYGARIDHFLPTFLVALSQAVDAALGLKAASSGALFLEHYLPDSAEEVLASKLGRRVSRADIVEVGNLVSHGGGQSHILFVALTELLCQLNQPWALFTATHEVRKLLNRLKIDQLPLAEADGRVLGDKLKDWGSYYDNKPVVVAVDARQARRALQGHPLGRLLLKSCAGQWDCGLLGGACL